jgi:electron transfer flavoprotein beta subunit
VRILTLLKYSLDVAEIKVDPSTHEIRLAGVPLKIGNIDKNVVEAAIRLKEIFGGEVAGLSFAPIAARESFRDVLAMGLDEVTLVEEPPDLNLGTPAVITVLEAAIRRLGEFDLILCGFASDDGYTYQVGPRLAERVGLPLISYARRLTIENDHLIADRDLDDCIETIRAPLPAVVSIAEEAFPPRRTTLMDALKAKKKPVNIWSIGEDLGLSDNDLKSKCDSQKVAEEGIVVKRKQQVIKDQSMAEMVDALLDTLLAEGVLKGKE